MYKTQHSGKPALLTTDQPMAVNVTLFPLIKFQVFKKLIGRESPSNTSPM